MTDTITAPRVYAAIAAVMSDIGKEGIGKDRSNTQQGYKFRGIDDVYNALSPILSRHNLCMLPRMLSRSVSERTTAKGGLLFYVIVEAEFDLISSEDASKHTVRTFGEAMDSGDKATNKAMSAAYKYAAMQAFAIPTEGDNDADSTTHDPIVSTAPAATTPPSKANARGVYTKHETAIRAAKDRDALRDAWKAALADKANIPLDWQKTLVTERDNRLADFDAMDAATDQFPVDIDPQDSLDRQFGTAN